MFEIKTLNKIAKIGLDRFPENFAYSEEAANPDGILVRSASLHDMALGDKLAAIARAGAGVNNIPIDQCSAKGIVVFNTPGANANAVKELVILGLLLSSRKVVDGISWAQTLKGEGDAVGKLVEKGKSAFAGPEIKGKKLGIIGLGAIGAMVANACTALGMEVYGYDPFLSVQSALKLSPSIKAVASAEQVYALADYITVHVPLSDKTRGLIGAEAFAQMKDGVRILNFARGGLVDNEAMKQALASGKASCYITDFPDESMLGVAGVIPIPHLGASTPESEDNCAVMAVEQIADYLQYGNIKNSVNFPNADLPVDSPARVCVLHKNVPAVLGALSSEISKEGINIENMLNKSKGDLAYTIFETDRVVSDALAATLAAHESVLRVRNITTA